MTTANDTNRIAIDGFHFQGMKPVIPEGWAEVGWRRIKAGCIIWL